MIKWSKYVYTYDLINDITTKRDNINVPNKIDVNGFIKYNKLNVDVNYRNEVLKRNGGVIEENYLEEMELLINGKKQTVPAAFSVSFFLGFVNDPEYDIANLFYQHHPDKKLLPIAMDTRGDLFYMDCNKKNGGGIYFELTDESVVLFDDTINPSDDSFEFALFKIADNFSDFVKLMHWVDEDEC